MLLIGQAAVPGRRGNGRSLRFRVARVSHLSYDAYNATGGTPVSDPPGYRSAASSLIRQTASASAPGAANGGTHHR